MYSSILIGVRGDADDHRTIELAHRLASPGSRLTLAHVSVITPLGGERDGLELELDAPGELRHAFANALSRCAEDTPIIREHAPSVGAGLSAAVDRVAADLLVMGSTWHHGLDRLLEGDDVQSALGHCRCAVAVADRETGPGAGPIVRIGVAYDATPEAEAAVEHARGLAESIRARLIPIHVAAPEIPTTRFGMVADPIEGSEAIVAAAARAWARSRARRCASSTGNRSGSSPRSPSTSTCSSADPGARRRCAGSCSAAPRSP